MPDGEDIAKPVVNNDANITQVKTDLNMKITLMLIPMPMLIYIEGDADIAELI